MRATKQLQDRGSNDVWAKIVLPTAFLGRKDKDKQVSSLWNEVWEEGGAAIGSRNNSFGVLLQEKLLGDLTHIIIENLRSTSWSNRLSACAVIQELADANILAPTPSSSYGIAGEFQERLKIRAAATCSILSETVEMIARSRVWAGKGEVIKSASLIAGKWTGSALGLVDLVSNNGKYHGAVPLVFKSKSHDDLFLSDAWFTLPDNEEELSEEQEVTHNEEEVPDSENNQPQNETLLCMVDEPNFDDQDVPNNNKDETKETPKSITFLGFCRLLCDQGLRVSKSEFTEGILPYKSAALESLSSFLRTVVVTRESENYNENIDQQRLVYSLLAPRLYRFISESAENSAPPLLVAKSLECLASAFYDGVGDENSPNYSNSLMMLKFFSDYSGAAQPAWTVRLSGVAAASSLVSTMSPNNLRKNDAIVTILDCSTHALKDRKFWKVR